MTVRRPPTPLRAPRRPASAPALAEEARGLGVDTAQTGRLGTGSGPASPALASSAASSAGGGEASSCRPAGARSCARGRPGPVDTRVPRPPAHGFPHFSRLLQVGMATTCTEVRLAGARRGGTRRCQNKSLWGGGAMTGLQGLSTGGQKPSIRTTLLLDPAGLSLPLEAPGASCSPKPPLLSPVRTSATACRPTLNGMTSPELLRATETPSEPEPSRGSGGAGIWGGH